jgi:hypothetical protein
MAGKVGDEGVKSQSDFESVFQGAPVKAPGGEALEVSAIATPIAQMPMESRIAGVEHQVFQQADDEFQDLNLDEVADKLKTKVGEKLKKEEVVVLSADDEFGEIDLADAGKKATEHALIVAKEVSEVEKSIYPPQVQKDEPIGMPMQNGLLAAHIQQHVEVLSPPPHQHAAEAVPQQPAPQQPSHQLEQRPEAHGDEEIILKNSNFFKESETIEEVSGIELPAIITNDRAMMNEFFTSKFNRENYEFHHVERGQISFEERQSLSPLEQRTLINVNKEKGLVGLYQGMLTDKHKKYILEHIKPKSILAFDDKMYDLFSQKITLAINNVIQQEKLKKDENDKKTHSSHDQRTVAETTAPHSKDKEKEREATPTEAVLRPIAEDALTRAAITQMRKEEKRAQEEQDRKQEEQKQNIADDRRKFELAQQAVKDANLTTEIQVKEKGLLGAPENFPGVKEKEKVVETREQYDKTTHEKQERTISDETLENETKNG